MTNVGIGAMSPNDLLNICASSDSEIEFQTGATSGDVTRLWVENGELKFEGNVDAAAQALFDMLRGTVDKYVAEKLAEVKEW